MASHDDSSQDADTADPGNSSAEIDVDDAAHTKVPDTFVSLCDDLAIASFTYRQLQECAKHFRIPCNLKKEMLADLVSARLKGRINYVDEKVAEVRSKRLKLRRERKKSSLEHDYNTLARAIINVRRRESVFKQEPSSHITEVGTSAHNEQIEHAHFKETSRKLLLKKMVNKCSTRNVTITQTESHTRIQMRPSLLGNCAQFLNQTVPMRSKHTMHYMNSQRPWSSNPNLKTPCLQGPYVPNMMQAGCSSNLLTNSPDYLPPSNLCSSYNPVVQTNIQKASQINFPARNVQVAATSSVSMLQDGSMMHFYNAKSSDYQGLEEKSQMSYNAPCTPAIETLNTPHAPNPRHPPYLQQQLSPWNMNQKYQQRYATPVEDFGGLDNKLRMRPALPFTETMEEQGVPLDHSYHVSEDNVDQQEVLPPFNTILHKKIHYDHRFIPSTVGSNQAFPADTASNTVYQESDNKERCWTECTPDQSHLFLQTETAAGKTIDIPTWTTFLEQTTPNKTICRYGCATFLTTEEERQVHEGYCLQQMATCPKPNCSWRNPLGSLCTHIFNYHNLEVFEGELAEHYVDLRRVNFTGEGPARLCLFQHAGGRLFIIDVLLNGQSEEIFISMQYLNDLDKSIPTAVMEVIDCDGKPLQWAERVNSMFPYNNSSQLAWVGKILPLSTSRTELTARRKCLILKTNRLVSQDGFKLYTMIRPHHLKPQ